MSHEIGYDRFTASLGLAQLGLACSLLVATAALGGCGVGQPESSAPPDVDIAAVIPYPQDPEAVVTFTVLGTDASGGVVVLKQGTITKGEQWRRLTRIPAPAAASGDNAIGTTSQAIVQETCWHGSPVVLNDGANFGGNYLCFNTFDNSRTELDFSIANPSFVMRSAYTVTPVVIRDTTNTVQFRWCNSGTLYQVNSYTGPRIRYVEMGSLRFGVCHL